MIKLRKLKFQAHGNQKKITRNNYEKGMSYEEKAKGVSL